MLKLVKRWFKKPRDPSGHVYYVRLATPQGRFYKLGYTSKPSLVDRFAFGGSGDEKLIERELLFVFRKDAWTIEQDLLDHFDSARAFGKFSNDPSLPLAGRGQSELFKEDVLGLDVELLAPTASESSALAEANDGCLLALIGLVLAPFTLGISLFLIAGGLSTIFSNAGKVPRVAPRIRRPAKVQSLIDSLTKPHQVA